MLGYFIIAVAKMLGLIFNVYTFIILGSVILSWVNADPYNPIVKIIRQLTEPVLRLVRRVMPRALFRTGLDFAPMIALLVLIFIETIVVSLLLEWGQTFLMQ